MSADAVPFGKVDEETTCPECEASIEVSMTQAIVEQDDEIVVTELGYYCPDCGHQWNEAPEPREPVTDGGQDVEELATRLIEIREEFEEIGKHVEELDIRDREVFVDIFDDQVELCLQLAQALEIRKEFDPKDHKLDDDRVLTDGGVAIQEDWPAAESEEDEWLCPDDDCSGVITPVPAEQEIGNDIWQCDTCEEFWGWHPS